MSRPATRLTRLVDLARLREEQARQTVAVARSRERAATARVDASESALRHPGMLEGHPFRFGTALLALGRQDLEQATGAARVAGEALEAELGRWRATHTELETLERLDDRLYEAFVAERRRQEQRETDELAGTRGRSER